MTKPSNIGYHCWVTNVTKRDILVGDLGVKIPAMRTVDLLDNRHSILTLDKVKKSLESGSLARRLATKPKQILIRQSEPEPPLARQIDLSKVTFPNKKRSTIKFEEKVFEELELDSTPEDEELFAEEMAESAVIDHAATIDLLKTEAK